MKIRLPRSFQIFVSRKKIGFVSCLLLFHSPLLFASPFTFTFQAQIVPTPGNLTTIPGVSVGDQFDLSVTVDNGNSSLIGQTWLISEVLSGTANVGAYSATYFPLFDTVFSYPYAFQTNGAGLISAVYFYDVVDDSNSDNFGIGGKLSNNAIEDSQSRYAFWSNGDPEYYLSNAALWADPFGSGIASSSPTGSAPEPETLALFALGLVVLGMSRGNSHK